MSYESDIKGTLTVTKELSEDARQALMILESMDTHGMYVSGGLQTYPVGTSIDVNGSFKHSEDQFAAVEGYVEGKLRISGEDSDDELCLAEFTETGLTERYVNETITRGD